MGDNAVNVRTLLESCEAMSTLSRHAARTWSMVSKSKPASPRKLPSTRSTCQPGRASPSGFTVAWMRCAGFDVGEGARGLGERHDGKKHVGVVQRRLPRR